MKESGKLDIKKCIIISIVIAIFVMIIFGMSRTKIVKYTYANELLKNEKFEKALNIFESLENYKDSEIKKKEAKIEYCKRNTGTMSGTEEIQEQKYSLLIWKCMRLRMLLLI